MWRLHPLIFREILGMKMMKCEIHLYMEVITRDVKFPTKLILHKLEL
jgi:hypothetical protein